MNRPHSLDCVDFKVMLSPYIDGELAPEPRFAADRHLIECQDCRTLLERAEANDETIRELCQRDVRFASHVGGPVGLPASFETAVLNRINRRQSVHVRRMRASLGLLAAAAAVALAAALWTIWPTSGSRQPENGRRERVDFPGSYVGDEGWESLAEGLHGPPMRASAERERSIPSISRDEAQALYGTALLLDELVVTPFENIATRNRLREMATYDELVERLGQIQPRLDSVSRRYVGAARSALFELQREQIEVGAWNSLQDDLRSLELIRELEAIATEGESRIGA